MKNREEKGRFARKENDMLYCSICYKELCKKEELDIHSHNAEPINNGRCCSECNDRHVIPARLKEIKNKF